jgi:hypothetical protein
MVSDKIYIKQINFISPKSETIHLVNKALCIIFTIIFAVSIADLLFVTISFNAAKSRGLVKSADANVYNLTLNDIQDYNEKSLKETNINPADFDSLKGKIVVIYRYDCEDCHKLYSELASLENVIYISSRTETGLAFREYFNPNLLKVPSGIYIRQDGKPVTLELYKSDNSTQAVSFDYDNWNRLLNIQAQDLILSEQSD